MANPLIPSLVLNLLISANNKLIIFKGLPVGDSNIIKPISHKTPNLSSLLRENIPSTCCEKLPLKDAFP